VGRSTLARRTAGLTLAALTLAAWMVSLGPVGAQERAGPASTATPASTLPDIRNVEIDPIRCWTRVSSAAVRVGEPFVFTLTCAVLETEAVQVVPDESRLGHSVVALAPFEVLSGTHPPDLRSGSRRFFQYDYRLRLITPDSIGTDVPVPTIQINYRINSRVAANTAMQGRELVYLLPTQYVRILSLVPNDANDIRDTSDPSFGRIEAVALRAGTLQIISVTLMALGAIMTIFALFGLVRRAVQTKGPSERLLGRPALMRLAVRELSRAQRDGSAQGWTPATVSRAAAAFRIAAATALAKPISQRLLDRQATVDESLFVTTRSGQRKRIAISSAVTSADAARERTRLSEQAGATRQQLLDEVGQTLNAFSAAQFGRASLNGGPSDLDALATKALEIARQVKAEHSWPRSWLQALSARVFQSERHA